MLNVLSFCIPGEPQAFLADASKWNKRTAKQRAYYEVVKECARQAGLDLPLMATEQNPILLHTVARFGRKNHPDPENVHKGIKDALFHVSRAERAAAKLRGEPIIGGNDKYTGGSYEPPLYLSDLYPEPCVEVEISGWMVDAMAVNPAIPGWAWITMPIGEGYKTVLRRVVHRSHETVEERIKATRKQQARFG